MVPIWYWGRFEEEKPRLDSGLVAVDFLEAAFPPLTAFVVAARFVLDGCLVADDARFLAAGFVGAIVGCDDC